MIVLDDIRSQSDYRFPSIVKNSYKEDLKLSKAIIEKRLAQNFRKDLTERKLEKKRLKIMLSTPASLSFFTQSSQYQI